jgi:hypothetical protein
MTRRPMQRLSELLPDAVAALGIGSELAAADRERSWTAVLAEVVPAAEGRCEVLATRAPELLIRASDAATAQELRLNGAVLLDALGPGPDGARLTELRVVVRPG